jgi:hypothetical protein
VLWVNCDEWFILGPLTVGLFLLGEVIQEMTGTRTGGARSGDRAPTGGGRGVRTLALVFVVGLAACLLNPYHLHAFTLPPEFGLSPGADLLGDDPQFRYLYLSPLRKLFYESGLGLSIAGLAYWPLLLAGLLSFAFTLGRTPWWRLLVWLAFALLSLFNARAIPFFAVVAGPITARNWLDFAADRLGAAPSPTLHGLQWGLGGRILSVVAGCLLLVATVPGWLQAKPYESHRVGWEVVVDPSLQEAALQIDSWRAAGQIAPGTHWFNTNPEIACYLAWFAPGERPFMDQRLSLFQDAAADYLVIRQGMGLAAGRQGEGLDGQGERKGAADWRKVLRRRGVRFLIMDNHGAGITNALTQQHLLANPAEWPLCYLHGRIAIFGWDDRPQDETGERREDPLAGLRLDLQRVAFGSHAEPAPPSGPEQPVKPEWYTALWQPRPTVAPDKYTALWYDSCFQARSRLTMADNTLTWRYAQAAVAVGLSAAPGPLPQSLLPLSWSVTYEDLFPPGRNQPSHSVDPRQTAGALQVLRQYHNFRDDGPPEDAYLVVRAARRALAVNPDDAQLWLLLASNYYRLGWHTVERRFSQASPLMPVRQTQLAGTLQRVLQLQPNPGIAAQTHLLLAMLFEQQEYRDLMAKHQREYLNALRAAGPQIGEPVDAFVKRLDDLAKSVEQTENEVSRRRNHYEVQAAANKPALQKAGMALGEGLAETALKELTSVSTSELFGRGGPGNNGVALILQLLLSMGRLDEARELLTPGPTPEGSSGLNPTFFEYQLRLAAASGDYQQADQLLAQALKTPDVTTAQRGSGLVGMALLREAALATGLPWFPRSVVEADGRRWIELATQFGLQESQRQVELHLLRGWLALEAGETIEARQQFQEVEARVVPPTVWLNQLNKLGPIPVQEVAGMIQAFAPKQEAAAALAQHYRRWLEPNR